MSELEISFRPNGNSAPFVRDGWGEVEAAGRWMVGPESRLVLPPPPWTRGPFELRALVGPHQIPGHADTQPIRVLVNGAELHSVVLTGVTDLRLTIPEGIIRDDSDAEIRFVHEGAIAPARVHGSGDLRELAVSIWSLTIIGPERPAASIGPARSGAPVFHLRSRGNLGNRMIQCMVGHAARSRAPGCVVAGVELDEWGLTTDDRDVPVWADHAVLDEQVIDWPVVTRILARADTRKVAYRGYGQRMENFPPLAACRALFPAVTDNVTEYDERFLVINVRAGDVLAGTIADYVLMPVNFYRELIERTRLIPVFIGQLDPSPYTAMLREAFPQARFVMSQGPMRDFETLRRARNIVVAVSTFSWLAAWLSDAARIHLPLNGLLNPLQYPGVDLLPLDDARYVFHQFPINHAVPIERLAAAHAAIDGQWRAIPAHEARALRDRVLPAAPLLLSA